MNSAGSGRSGYDDKHRSLRVEADSDEEWQVIRYDHQHDQDRSSNAATATLAAVEDIPAGPEKLLSNDDATTVDDTTANAEEETEAPSLSLLLSTVELSPIDIQAIEENCRMLQSLCNNDAHNIQDVTLLERLKGFCQTDAEQVKLVMAEYSVHATRTIHHATVSSGLQEELTALRDLILETIEMGETAKEATQQENKAVLASDNTIMTSHFFQEEPEQRVDILNAMQNREPIEHMIQKEQEEEEAVFAPNNTITILFSAPLVFTNEQRQLVPFPQFDFL